MKKLVVLLGVMLLVACCAGSAIAGPAVTGGLLVYYSFNDYVTGAGSVTDGSGNGYNGIVGGTNPLTSVQAGKFGKSIQFAVPTEAGNATSYVNLPVASMVNTPTSGITVAAWVKTRPDGPFHQEVFSAQIATTMGVHTELRTPSGGYRFVLRDEAGTRIFDTTFDIGGTSNYLVDGNPAWQHIAFTYDKNASGNQIKVYVNGSVAEGPAVNVLNIAPVWKNATVGATADNYTRPFAGEIDEFYLFNRALSAAEINKLMEETYTATFGIVLGDFQASTAGIPVSADITDSSNNTRTVNTALDASSQFAISDLTAGDYTLAIKPSHWLRHAVPGAVTVTADSLIGLSHVFINGDCDGDNEVTSTDLSIVLSAMDSLEGDATWDPTADLDGDLEITSTDLSILLASMDMIGD